jgi:oxygen-independent coproporphyrinogen-3 oxidase
MWLHAVEKLEGAGYTQTTGHSFVRDLGHDHVQRNSIWGAAGELLGMGVSSYSYMNGTVFQNTSDWGSYVGKITHGESAVGRGLRLNSRQRMAREVILGLKMLSLDRRVFRHRHGLDVLDLWGPQVEALRSDGLLEVTDEAITLTRRARAYVDVVCSVFYLAEHSEWKFHRFATEDELSQAADLALPELAAGHSIRTWPLLEQIAI